MRSRLARLVLRAQRLDPGRRGAPHRRARRGAAHVQLGLRHDAARHVARRCQSSGAHQGGLFRGPLGWLLPRLGGIPLTATTPVGSSVSSSARPAAASPSCSSSRRRARERRGSTGSRASGASRVRRACRSPWPSSTVPVARRDSAPTSRRQPTSSPTWTRCGTSTATSAASSRAAHRAAAARGAGRRGRQQLTPAYRVCRRPHLPRGAGVGTVSRARERAGGRRRGRARCARGPRPR